MKEKFEHKISEKTKEVFSSHPVDYNPQDWESMKALLPVKKSGILIFWKTWYKIAAVIIVALAGIYLFWGRTTPIELSNEDKLSAVPTENTLKKNEMDSVLKQALKNNSKQIENNSVLAEEKHSEAVEQSTNSEIKIQKLDVANLDNKSPNKSLDIADSKNPLDAQDPNDSFISADKNTEMLIASIPIEHKTNTDIPNGVQTLDSTINDNEIKEEPALAILIQESDIKSDTLNGEQIQLEKTPSFVSPMSTPKKEKVKLGVELASFTNYSENISPSVNYGGGIAATIPIKRRFSFNPGLVFSAYNMNLQDNSNHISETEYSSISTFGVDKVNQNNSNIKPSQVQLNSLDIPLNFQYQFINRAKGKYFVELGFSSLMYLSENYSYDFTYIDNSGCPPGQTCTVLATVSESSSEPAFKTFDFAKLINFSVGLDYPLSKRFDMIINPYLKYPVNSLSGAELKFGSGGMKLRFMIKPNK